MTRTLVTAGALALYSIGSAYAVDDWPQWRGPERTGISAETQWSNEGRDADVWKCNVGIGYSNVTISDGLLYTMGYDVEAGNDIVRCVDAHTGNEIWQHAYPAERWNLGHEGGSLSTPVVHGEFVYTKNREGKAFCFNARTGDIAWSRDLAAEHGVETGKWGFSSSPLIVGDAVVLDADKTIALHRTTGEVVWESDSYGQAYATPIDFKNEDGHYIAVFNKTGLVILNAADGSEVAVHEWPTFNDINAASPILLDDGRIFISSGANHGCALFEFANNALNVLWESKVMQTAMNAAVLYDEHLYGFNNNRLCCIDLEGQSKWSERSIGLGAMSMAGDRMLILSDEGELIIARATPDAFTELARQKVLEGGVYWTTPVIVDGFVYVRNSLGDLVCRDHRITGETD